MNEESHWNGLAEAYEDEIFDVFRSDKLKRLSHYFDKHAQASHDVIDFGCGIGKAFPYLSPRFRHVLATDISAECISIAKKRGYTNITYKRTDLTRKSVRFPTADFGFCCNVVMLPEIEKNIAMLLNIQKSLKPGGSAVLVLPSLESILYSSGRMLEWYRKEGVAAAKVPDAELDYYKGNKKEIIQGIIRIDGVPTKHYLEPELRSLCANVNFKVTALEKIEYDWKTEFESPPQWMREPFPWDWLVEVKKD